MLDAADLLETPKTLLLAVLRALWWLSWDFCCETIGWSIGWSVLRLLSLGRFPAQRLAQQAEAPAHVQLVVEIVGLAVLGGAIWRLSGVIPG